jgi:hypothetical protein
MRKQLLTSQFPFTDTFGGEVSFLPLPECPHHILARVKEKGATHRSGVRKLRMHNALETMTSGKLRLMCTEEKEETPIRN